MDEKKPAYWAVLPADVRHDPELRPNAKLLYAEISALLGEDGYCWASDRYFARLFGLSECQVNRLLHSLQQRGYIRIEAAANSRGTERHIYAGVFLARPAGEGPAQKSGIPRGSRAKTQEGSCAKTQEGSCAKTQEGSCAKTQDPSKVNNLNITRTNMTRDPLPPKAEKAKFLPDALVKRAEDYAGEDGELRAALLAFAENRWAIRKPIRTDRALTLLLNKLDRLSGGDRETKLALIDKAVECNWLSVFPLREDRSETSAGYIPEASATW